MPSVYGLEKGIIHTVDKFDSVEGPRGTTKIYFTGISDADDRIVKLINTTNFKTQNVEDEIDNKTIRIYMSNPDLSKKTTYTNVALILLKQSAYYIDEEGDRIDLNVLVNLEQVDFKPINIADSGKCNNKDDNPCKQFWNNFSILNIKENGVMYAANVVLTDNLIEFSEHRPTKGKTDSYLKKWDASWKKYKMYQKEKDGKSYKLDENGNKVKILPYPWWVSNLHYVISFTLKVYTGNEDMKTGYYGDELEDKVANNMSLLWSFKDLDQPDDDYNDGKDYNTDKNAGYDNANIKNSYEDGGRSSYMGEYSEGVQFNNGFSNDFYLLNGHTLRISNNDRRFNATQTTNKEGTPKNSNYSTVRGYQIGTSATVEWWGSEGLATTILGTTPTYEVVPKYTGNKCAAKENNFKVKCDENFVRENNTKSVNGFFDEKNEIFTTAQSTSTNDDDDSEDLPPATWSEHSSCSPKNISLDLFFKENKYVYTKQQSGVYVKSESKCGSVKVTVPVVLTENLNLYINKPYGSGSDRFIYPGGGFTWDGARITNEVSWLYSFSRENYDHPLFHITYNYGLNKDKNKKDTKFVSLSDSGIRLYTDSSCSSSVTQNVLNNRISNEVSETLEKNNNKTGASDATPNLTNKFTSVDYNDPSIKDRTMPVNNTTDKEIDSNGNAFQYTNTASLLTAYINVIDANVTYDDVKNNNEFRNGGNLYYVPLKYTAPSTQIEMNNKMLSIIGQEDTYTATCELLVHQGGIVYECIKNCEGGDGNVKISYRYRTIDVNDPFNDKNASQIASTAQNWSDWYKIDANKRRLSDTYNRRYPNNPLYRVVLNNYNGSKVIQYNDANKSYISFNDMNANGESSFINDNSENMFIIKNDNRSYCGLGIFKTQCDIPW